MTKTSSTTKTSASAKKTAPRPKKAAAPKAKKASAAKPKAAKTPKLPYEWRVLRAAFDLIEERGWASFELEDVIGYARLDPDELFQLVERKSDLLLLLSDMIDQAMVEGGLAEGSVRDSLFDLLMRRFEALQPWRAGVEAIIADLASDPTLPLVLAPAFHNSMTLVLEMAGVAPTRLREVGLSVVALATFKDWLREDSSDLSSTMASLDKKLAQLEELAGFLDSLGL